MLRPARGLSEPELTEIAGLETRVVAHDGGRLKLEWGRLRGRDGRAIEDVLAWEGERLVGFTGLYGHSPRPEIAGMVDPAHRRRGLGAALLDAILAVAGQRGDREALVIVPRQSGAGRALAERRGGELEHSEHALALRGNPAPGPSDPRVSVRDATDADGTAMRVLLTAGFGFAPSEMVQRLHEPGTRTLTVERDGEIVGTLRVADDGQGRSGVYGFAIAPEWRGQGIGRDVLRRVCAGLRADGVREVGLEVEVENDAALHLYTSLGFQPVITEDYYRVSTGAG